MAIIFYTEEVKWPAFLKKRALGKWLGDVAASYGKRTGAVSYLFCTDEKILEVNRCFLQHDYYTDIITFDYTEGDVLSGDLYISLETVRSNSEQFRTTFEEELLRVIIHGILHLCGLKDKSAAEQAKMRAAEEQALRLFLRNGDNLKETR
ncbi:MAG: rRNA maturation RNase YbeY [Tannerella sp.]|jgi:rRNA maturation RNase YbeY|nr:rRNA maturation RNase YbeY [Tannerella sp.]